MRAKRTKTKNRILPISAAPAAIPPKPNIAAMIATTKKMNAQCRVLRLLAWGGRAVSAPRVTRRVKPGREHPSIRAAIGGLGVGLGPCQRRLGVLDAHVLVVAG